MRDYEVVYIFDSTLDQSVIDQKLERFNQLVSGNGSGEITAVEHWGKRQLAYPIRNQENGYYVVVQFRTDPEHLTEFERIVRLDEGVLRHLVVLSEGELPTPPSAGGRPAERDDDEDEDEDEDGDDGEN